MVQTKKDTSADDVYRHLLNEKTKRQRKKLALILEPYDIKYQNVWNWLKGRKDRNSKPYLPRLNSEDREKLLACLRELYPLEMKEIEHDAPMRALLAQASEIATLVPTPTELDRFVEYVRDGAIITSVTAHSVTAEGGESTRTYEPREGLTEEVYHRLTSDDLILDTAEALAWGVIENLLLKRGISRAQIQQARRRVAKRSVTHLVEASTFEVVVNILATEVTKAPIEQE